MKEEIKEILEALKPHDKEFASIKEYPLVLSVKEQKILLDYITNLQEQLHQASLDIQELIEKDIGCPSWCDKLTNLQQENERLKEQCKEWKENHKAVCIQRDNILDNIVKDTEKRIDYIQRNEKAIEFIEEKISSTKGVINDYMYHKEHNKILIELLQEDIKLYKKELNILKGDKDE